MRYLLPLALSALPLAASAATVSWAPSSSTGTPMPIAASTTGDVLQNTTGSVTNYKLSPFSGRAVTSDDAFAYTSVGRDSSATYDFGFDAAAIRFIWGSADGYNSLAFFRDGALVDAYRYDGALGFGGLRDEAPIATVTAAGLFDAVRFESGDYAFEFAGLEGVPRPVPLPAGLSLLGTALGGFGTLAWLKRKSAARRSAPKALPYRGFEDLHREMRAMPGALLLDGAPGFDGRRKAVRG